MLSLTSADVGLTPRPLELEEIALTEADRIAPPLELDTPEGDEAAFADTPVTAEDISDNAAFTLGEAAPPVSAEPPPETAFACAVFDPFEADAAVDDDEPPFDAPTAEELAARALNDRPEDAGEAEAEAPVAPPPQHKPAYAPSLPPPMRPARTIAFAPQDDVTRACVTKVRQSLDHKRSTKRRGGRIALGLGAAFAGPLAFGAVMTAHNYLDGAYTPVLTPAAASAAERVPGPPASTPAPPPPIAPDPSADYAAALTKLDSEEGVALMQRAADAGYAMAQYRLAKLFEGAAGMEADLARARQWTERAAAAGNCRAMHDAGVFNAHGEGAAPNERAAFGWFQRAAQLGVADSQYNLGVLYAQGRGIGADAGEALYWFLVAARQGDLNAIDRAVEIAAQLTPVQIEEVRTRARAFAPSPADPVANGAALGASHSCAVAARS